MSLILKSIGFKFLVIFIKYSIQNENFFFHRNYAYVQLYNQNPYFFLLAFTLKAISKSVEVIAKIWIENWIVIFDFMNFSFKLCTMYHFNKWMRKNRARRRWQKIAATFFNVTKCLTRTAVTSVEIYISIQYIRLSIKEKKHIRNTHKHTQTRQISMLFVIFALSICVHVEHCHAE